MKGRMQQPPQKPTVKWNNVIWVLVIWMAVAYLFQAMFPGTAPQTLTYTKFRDMVRQGEIAAVTIRGNVISRGELANAEASAASGPAGGALPAGE